MHAIQYKLILSRIYVNQIYINKPSLMVTTRSVFWSGGTRAGMPVLGLAGEAAGMRQVCPDVLAKVTGASAGFGPRDVSQSRPSKHLTQFLF